MAIRRWDTGSQKASNIQSGSPVYHDTSPPFREYDDYMGTEGRAAKERILAHSRRADPLTGELRTGSGHGVDFSTASGRPEGPGGMDPYKMSSEPDYGIKHMESMLAGEPDSSGDPYAYAPDAFETAYREPSIEKRADSFFPGEMVEMPGIREGDGRMWSGATGELMTPKTSEELEAESKYMGYSSEEDLDYARSVGMAPPKGLELPEGYRKSLRRSLAGSTPTKHELDGYESADDYYRDSYGKEYIDDPWRRYGFGKWSEII